MPRRLRDVAGLQAGSGHLVEKWLEGVVVVPVDDQDVEVLAPKVAHDLGAAVAGAYDDDARPRPRYARMTVA